MMSVALAGVGLVATSAPTAAEEARPWAGAFGVSGYAAVGGPAHSGLAATAALYPGASAGRVGIRLDARTTGEGDRFDGGLFTAGLAFEAAAARPRLSLALHAEGGATVPDPRPAIGGGAEIQLWLLGPVALAAGASAHVLIDGLDTELVLAGEVGLRVAR